MESVMKVISTLKNLPEYLDFDIKTAWTFAKMQAIMDELRNK